MKKAAYYKKLDNEVVHCLLCPQGCILKPGKRGICLTRLNVEGHLITENYEHPVSISMDPIEKKPLYHFFPGSQILSTGPNGCNIKCLHCQNCDISQHLVQTKRVTSGEMIHAALKHQSIGIAYTYTEPFIWFEYLLECSQKAHDKGLKNVLVTNGFVNPEPLRELLPHIDAMNIDIKSMDNEFYKKICKAKLKPVLRTCEASKRECHVEITNLLITELNDSDDWISKLVDYVAGNLGDDTPVHFSRYFPRNKMTNPQTPLERIEAALRIGKETLKYVYAGNVHIPNSSNTTCFACGAELVNREGYLTNVIALKNSSCQKCETMHNFSM